MKRNAFGQLIPALHARSFFDGDNGGAGGGSEYKPPASQEELDKIVNGAVARAHKKYEGHDELKEKAAKWEAHEAEEAAKRATPAGKSDDHPAGVSEADVDKRINDALAANDLAHAIERVGDALDKKLEGRTFSASLLLNLDRKQFVKDGKSVDTEKVDEWVQENSKELEQPAEPRRRGIPGQGERDTSKSAGNVQSGRELYDDQNKKKQPPRKD